jgi:hypothetical protein
MPGRPVVLVLEPAERHDAGVVDEHVNGPELLLDVVKELGEPTPVSDIEREGKRIPVDLVSSPFGEIKIKVPDSERSPKSGEGRGSSSANPTCPTSNNNNLANE